MEFNGYIWQLYRESKQGSETIRLFELLQNYAYRSEISRIRYQDTFEKRFKGSPLAEGLQRLLKRIEDEGDLSDIEVLSDLVWEALRQEANISVYLNEEFQDLFDSDDQDVIEKLKKISHAINESQLYEGIDSLEKAEVLFDLVDEYGIWDHDDELEMECFYDSDDNERLGNIDIISLALSFIAPDYFLPYLFSRQFYRLQAVAEIFLIDLPPVPVRRQYRERFRYYWKLCELLYEFRTQHHMTAAELCAFLYDFAHQFIDNYKVAELPEPAGVYMTGGHRGDQEYLETADDNTSSFWAGDTDTLPGDIVVMYALNPMSCVHSIWRALTPGFADPFFYYRKQVLLGHYQRVKPITQKEMESDPILGQWGLVRGNMQGVGGRYMDRKYYDRLLELLREKGEDIDRLPKPAYTGLENNSIEIKNERDVEIHLLEPLLHKLGYSDSDWVRQLVVRMGRGDKVYPDYVLQPQTRKGEESGRFVCEAKFRIPHEKQLHQDFLQARSYALRLSCEALMLVAFDGVWISSTNDGYVFKKIVKYSWNDLREGDGLYKLRQQFGKTRAKNS